MRGVPLGQVLIYLLAFLFGIVFMVFSMAGHAASYGPNGRRDLAKDFWNMFRWPWVLQWLFLLLAAALVVLGSWLW